MNVQRLAAVVVCILAAGSIAGATCVVRQRRVVQTAVVPVLAPIATAGYAVPSYGATYDASAAELPRLREQISALQARIAVLETARSTHEGRLAVLENKSGVRPPPAETLKPPTPTQPPAGKPRMPPADGDTSAPVGLPAAYVRSCVACHTAGANPKGGLALVDPTGKRATDLTPQERLEIIRRINLVPEDNPTEVMPPPPAKGKATPNPKIHEQVGDAENAEILDFLTRKK